jgi:hypothetical protein
MIAIFTGELVFTSGVPKSDTRIGTSRDDLSIIRREGASEDFFLVTDEESLGLTGLEVPKSHGLIPRGRDKEVVIIGETHV